MLTFAQYIKEAKESSGVPGRGGEGWGSSSDNQSAIERAAEYEAEQRRIAQAERERQEAAKQAERKRQEAAKQAERKRQEAAKKAEEELHQRAMREYGFAQYWDELKGKKP